LHICIALYGTQESIENWAIGEVTLPLRPSQVTDDNPAKTEYFERDGAEPIIYSNPGARTVTLDGFISSRTATKSELNVAYLAPLRALKGKVVSVVDPHQIYVGDWMLKQVQFREVAEGNRVARFSFHIVLEMGYAYLDLSQASED
jgi:hypothetical protein